jgi:SAM-dependent methyltransferase
MRIMKTYELQEKIRERYGALVEEKVESCCGGERAEAVSCCDTDSDQEALEKLGYSKAQIASLPEGANLGVGCGNPIDLAAPKKGETVLDLGSGAGIDCFLASDVVGAEGSVIGVDFTPPMIEKARRNAENVGKTNVEFRLGEIEHLPAADASVDVVISNCVINLSVDKAQVFREAYRVLRPGGRLAVSDIVLNQELPEEIRNSVAAYAACVAGASMQEEYLQFIRDAGFQDAEIVNSTTFGVDPEKLKRETGSKQAYVGVVSAAVRAVKK